MDQIFFSVSLNGYFVFRTDIFDSEAAAKRAQDTLMLLPAGYRVDMYRRPASWNSSEVTLLQPSIADR